MKVDLRAVDKPGTAGINRHAEPLALRNQVVALRVSVNSMRYSNPLHPPPATPSRTMVVSGLFFSAKSRLSSFAARSVSFTAITVSYP